MSDAAARFENLLTLTTRLAAAVEADIAALDKGKFPPLALTDPEVDRLSALYAREVGAARQAGVKDTPLPLLRSLKEAGAKLKTLLKQHERLVTAMKGASEGMVKAVAEEVEKARTAAMPYAATPQPRRPTGAIVYNRVV